MENSKTIVCPNCGAVSTNLDKCEYCGSILVKIASILAPSSEDTMSEMKKLGFGKTVYVSPKILEAVEKCISLSERLTIPTVVKFCSNWNTNKFNIEFECNPTSHSILKFIFDMNNGGNDLRYHLFEQSQIAKMFEIYQDAHYMRVAVTLDNDAKTISQFIRHIICGIFMCSDDERMEICLFTYLNNLKYEFASECKSPIEFATSNSGYSEYMKEILMEGKLIAPPRDKALYDIIYADPILRYRIDPCSTNLSTDTLLKVSKGSVIWNSEESKQKYIARSKEISSRSYYIKNIYPNEEERGRLWGLISEDYDPQMYGPIEEYIKKEEDKIHKEAALDAERIANIIQRRHEVAVSVGKSVLGWFSKWL